MSKSIEQRATEVLTRASFGGAFVLKTEVAVRALREANLLAHPLAEEAMEACREYARIFPDAVAHRDRQPWAGTCVVDGVRSVGRRILESEKKDKGPWRVQPAGDGGVGSAPMLVCDARSIALVGMTDAEARSCAENLNSLHRKERQP